MASLAGKGSSMLSCEYLEFSDHFPLKIITIYSLFTSNVYKI